MATPLWPAIVPPTPTSSNTNVTPASPWTHIHDLVWNVSTFLDAPDLARMQLVSSSFYEAVDDHVWKELCSRFIYRLPANFGSYKQYYSYVTMGKRIQLGEKNCYGTLPARVVQNGAEVSIGLIDSTQLPVVRIISQNATVLLTSRPEFCFIGCTDLTTPFTVERLDGSHHAIFALPHMTPGSVLHVQVLDGRDTVERDDKASSSSANAQTGGSNGETGGGIFASLVSALGFNSPATVPSTQLTTATAPSTSTSPSAGSAPPPGPGHFMPTGQHGAPQLVVTRSGGVKEEEVLRIPIPKSITASGLKIFPVVCLGANNAAFAVINI